MFRVCDNMDNIDGTSRMGEMDVKYKDLILTFGQPMESDGYKVSGEWVFMEDESGEVFTLYDWKMTELYDSDGLSVDELRTQDKVVTVNIGGNHKGDVERFKRLVLRQIEFMKTGKPFEQILLGIKED